MTTNDSALPGDPSVRLTHPSYRPDIDGLRAVAVLGVVGFHAFPKSIHGGFVGVDVFFVISGFLISSIIFSSLERGSFGFLAFYARRIRRIFPALLALLLACIVFGWISLFADEYQQLGKHIAAGAGFVSNLVLWSESGYFDSAADKKPLLHLWSLGVEEQFYIFWPAIAWVAWKTRTFLLPVVLALLAVSFLHNVLTAANDQVADFYSPLTRFWELLAGSILALSEIPAPSNALPARAATATGIAGWLLASTSKTSGPTTANVRSAAGAVLIAAGILLVSKEDHFPGILAALPVLGAVLIIGAGAQAWFNRAVLSHRIFVWFGLISYPLYLWHWPLLTFARIVKSKTLPPAASTLAVLAAILLAWLTYRLVEVPIRSGSWARSRRTAPTLFALMAMAAMVGYATFAEEGFPFRYAKDKTQYPVALDAANVRAAGSVHMLEDDPYFAPVFRGETDKSEPGHIWSNRPTDKAEAGLAMLGDSHALVLFIGLVSSADDPVVVFEKGTCPPFLGVDVRLSKGQFKACQPFVDNYLERVKNSKSIKAILLTAFFAQYNRSVFLTADGQPISVDAALARTVSYLSDSGKKIVLAYDVPEVPQACYPSNSARVIPVQGIRASPSPACQIPKASQDLSERRIGGAVDAHAAVARFLPSSYLCNEAACGEIDARNYLYIPDGNHLNSYGARQVGGLLQEFLKAERIL